LFAGEDGDHSRAALVAREWSGLAEVGQALGTGERRVLGTGPAAAGPVAPGADQLARVPGYEGAAG